MAIPYGAKRRADMAAYSLRHYGQREWRLRPRAVVQHWTQTSSVRSTVDIFRPNVRDGELRELPGTCSHFVISGRGTIYQLVSLGIRCRHAFGMNHVSIGIEHVGYSDSQVMGNRRQLAASLALTRWLACRYGIEVRDVVGHAETLRSRWYREIHPERFGNSTHSDFGGRAMRSYRASLARRPCP
jgi:beta-N-acetylhexosaminidase